VTHLKVDDVLLSEQADKAHVVDCFFDHLLGSAPERGQFIDLYFLEAKFTEGEVWQVIKCQEQDKALGLDGFTGPDDFTGLHLSWQIIKANVMEAFTYLW
jgi:hypothetical protein